MFSKTEIKTRFTETHELNKVNIQLKSLRERTKGMEGEAKDVESIAYQKFSTLNNFLKEVDDLISQFNKEPKPTKKKEELLEIGELLIEINGLIAELSVGQMKDLLSFRDDSRKNTEKLVRYGTIGLSVAAGFTFLGPVGVVAGFFSGKVVSNWTNYYTGLLKSFPESMKILNNLRIATQKAIEAIETNLNKSGMTSSAAFTIEKVKFVDNVPSQANLIPGIVYLSLDNEHGFLALTWKVADQIKHVSLNTYLNENEKCKETNQPLIDDFNAALLVASFRCGHLALKNSFLEQKYPTEPQLSGPK